MLVYVAETHYSNDSLSLAGVFATEGEAQAAVAGHPEPCVEAYELPADTPPSHVWVLIDVWNVESIIGGEWQAPPIETILSIELDEPDTDDESNARRVPFGVRLRS